MAVRCVLIKWSKISRFKSFVFNSLWFVIIEILCFLQRRRNVAWKQWRRGWSQKGQREGQELDNRMCWHHIKSEPRAQTFMLHARPSPLCVSEWVKLPPHWRCDDPTKREFVWLFGRLSCVRTQVHISSCDMKTSPVSFETPSCFRDAHALHQVAS